MQREGIFQGPIGQKGRRHLKSTKRHLESTCKGLNINGQNLQDDGL